MEIVAARAADLFIGSESAARQVVRINLRGTDAERRAASLSVRGDGIASDGGLTVGSLAAGEEVEVELGVIVQADRAPGSVLGAVAALAWGSEEQTYPFEFVVAEPGWRMFMVSHFHYDPVWWNTQAAYTEAWDVWFPYRLPFQEPGLALVKAHLEMARRDSDYKFVLAELDYLKPYWDVYPEDRAYIRQLMSDGRLELMGGTYNEPNTNLTSAETTVRNVIYGIGYQRHVLGGQPATAWQLDAFGHDPQFPAITADAGITSSSWARGPFHEWGPNWMKFPGKIPVLQTHRGDAPRMQFSTEFDWTAPSGESLLTSFMADHYSAGWWMDLAPTLRAAEEQALRLFTDLRAVATTKNVLLPVGTDYTPPNKWVTEIHRDWNRRYVWPKFISAIPREFFDAVRAERATSGRRGFSPQTRDMNPVYTGKDVSFIDTKQAQRAAENTLLAAEKFATIASLVAGAGFPSEALDKSWRQLLFGAHHDGITGSESDQVYLDLLGGWREATELGRATLDQALGQIALQVDTSGAGSAVMVFNPLSWRRTDLARVTLEVRDSAMPGFELHDDAGASVPFVADRTDEAADGSPTRYRIAFVARDLPAIGYRIYHAIPAASFPEGATWVEVHGRQIENERYLVEVDPDRGGAITSLVDKFSGRQLLQAGRLGNELLAYREYPNHPHFGEGPWHLTPDGTSRSTAEQPVEVGVQRSAIGQRLRIAAPFQQCRRAQEIVLWNGLERIDFTTRVEEYTGHDLLFRVRFSADVEGGTPISEVGNAVVGRGFGFPDGDVAKTRFTLDNPAYNWFGLGTTVRVDLVDAEGATPRASRSIGVAEVVVPGDPAQDDAVRQLMIALVRRGVTATLSRHDASRYGTLDIDSNLPDVRICLGGPAINRFADALLRDAEDGYAVELEAQLASRGVGRLWIPAAQPLADTWQATADLRGVRELPVLIVAGADEAATLRAIKTLARDVAYATLTVQQPPELDGTTGKVADYTVALLNRGLPGFNVSTDGSLYLSLMRSCSGWPSGVWIDPPRRTAPDGSNFQFQHWSHTFEYALTSAPGDWRKGEMVRHGHEYNNPLLARVEASHSGQLPPLMSFVEVEPASAVLAAMKPVGNPHSRMAEARMDAADGITFRVYESSGRSLQATIRAFQPLGSASITNVLEDEQRQRLPVQGGVLAVDLEPSAIVTVRGVFEDPATVQHAPERAGENVPSQPVSRTEAAQPVFADYWLHNKGAAPMGYQPLAVQIPPAYLAGGGPFQVPVRVASSRTDVPVAGSVELVVPAGWRATPPSRLFRLAPGAFVAFDSTVAPSDGVAPGRYFVAARIQDESGQQQEDVVTVDYFPGADSDGETGISGRSAALSRAVERGLYLIGRPNEVAEPSGLELGGELEIRLLTPAVTVSAGSDDQLRIAVRNVARSEIRGEVQIISPHETWPFIRPWTQGFAVAPAATMTVTFEIDPPFETEPGAYWALAKVMYFGRLYYCEAVPIVITQDRPAKETKS